MTRLLPSFSLAFTSSQVSAISLAVVACRRRAEHVRVAEDHLVADLVDAVRDVKGAFFLADARIENDMVQQVAESFAVPLRSPFRMVSLSSYTSSSDSGRIGFEGLGGVPGALLPEGVHDIQQAAERRNLFFPGVHIIRLMRCKYTKNLRIFA
jgi:hypothetical protein